MEMSGSTRMLHEFCPMIAVWILSFRGVQPHVPYAYGYLFK